jgi:hypothetical protein
MSTEYSDLCREWAAHRRRIEQEQAEALSKSLLMPLLQAAYRSGREPEWNNWTWDDIRPMLERQLPDSVMVRKAVKELIRAAYQAEAFATRLERRGRVQ